eukprot:TRINITY_DN6446_c0_g1_i1.p1 TRINITY_DN6446_c0_g1~~TRINITY_DN6446_c0_g1_i1.p1  ORF type:complete len:258 (+),score=90.87 TRINITY_DN6446_c0_g1_i1:15-788(+)
MNNPKVNMVQKPMPLFQINSQFLIYKTNDQILDVPVTPAFNFDYERQLIAKIEKQRKEELEKKEKGEELKLSKQTQFLQFQEKTEKNQQEQLERQKVEEDNKMKLKLEMQRVLEEQNRQKKQMMEKKLELERKRKEEERLRQERLIQEQQRNLTLVEKESGNIVTANCNMNDTIQSVIQKLNYDTNKFEVTLSYEESPLSNNKMTLKYYGVPDNAVLLVDVVDLQKFSQMAEDGIPCETCGKIVAFELYSGHVQICK